MMLLNQNTANLVYLSLSDSTTLTSLTPYYLFRFIDYASNDEIRFTTANISTALTRYDQFVITLTGLTYQNLTGGTIYMKPEGEWKYEIYQQYSQTNLFLSGTTGGVIEYGLIKLSGTPNTYINQTYTGSPQTYAFYNG